MCNADVLRYVFKDMLWSFVSELVVHIPLSTFMLLTSPFRCILSSAKRRCMVFWKAPGWKARSLLIVDFVIATSQLTQCWSTSCSEAMGTAVGSGVGIMAVLTANSVTPSLVSVWQAICPASAVPKKCVPCWIHQSWQLTTSAVLSARRWAVVKATAAKRLIPTSNVELSYMAKSPQAQQTAVTDGLSSQADVSTVMLLKEAQHTDADKQPDLLKAHRAEPSKAVSKEPSAKPSRAGAKGNKAPAGPRRAQPGAPASKPSLVADQAQAGIDGNLALAVRHQAEAAADSNKPSAVTDHAQTGAVGIRPPALLGQAQAGADGNTHLGLPDQAQDDSTWPVLNKRARKQLRKASQAAAADETPDGHDDESEADAAADSPNIPEGKDIELETPVAVVPQMKSAKSGSLPILYAYNSVPQTHWTGTVALCAQLLLYMLGFFPAAPECCAVP